MDLLVALTFFALVGYVVMTSKGDWRDALIIVLGAVLAIAYYLPHET